MATLTMQSEAMPHGYLASSPANPVLPLKSALTGKGALLALDGRCMNRQALPMALQLSKQYGHRLDILLLNPPKPAPQMLGPLLQQLEAAGIDYRLISSAEFKDTP